MFMLLHMHFVLEHLNALFAERNACSSMHNSPCTPSSWPSTCAGKPDCRLLHARVFLDLHLAFKTPCMSHAACVPVSFQQTCAHTRTQGTAQPPCFPLQPPWCACPHACALTYGHACQMLAGVAQPAAGPEGRTQEALTQLHFQPSSNCWPQSRQGELGAQYLQVGCVAFLSQPTVWPCS